MTNMNQNLNNININQENKVEDVLPYINEPKMVLKFSTISSIKNGTYITVKLPKSITKSDLYSIAKKYQEDFYSTIILSCNNYLLKEDDTTIEGIEEGSIINIIEDIDIPDGSYYRELMKKNENYEKVYFHFKIHGLNEKIKKIQFPKNITVSEMMKGAFSKLLLNSKSSKIQEISSHDYNNKISSFNKGLLNIHASDPLEDHWRFGKKINVFVYENEKKQCTVLIGILNSIKQLIYNIRLQIGRKDLLKLYFSGNREFLINEIGNFSLKSIGINKDVNCSVEFSDSKEHV